MLHYKKLSQIETSELVSIEESGLILNKKTIKFITTVYEMIPIESPH